jgi:aflatoxin B1 aldehyde reductase
MIYADLQAETYFLHSPDPDTPIEETMEAIQELYKAGKFKHVSTINQRSTPGQGREH